MTALPPVSVIVPCYCCAATLDRAVKSVLDGAPQNLELLLVDDGSPDATPALCDAWAARDPRVRALHRPNGGASAARNTGLDAATGDWVLFLDADDELLPGLWAALPDALNARPGLVLFGLRRASCGQVPCPLPAGALDSLALAGADALAALLFTTGYLAAPYPKLFEAARLRRSALRFDEALAVNEDVKFNLDYLALPGPAPALPAVYVLPGAFYLQNDVGAGSLSRRLRGDLLDAEVACRPSLQRLLRALSLPEADAEALLRQSRVRAALNQYGLLTGQAGSMPLARRRALFARILADEDARAALRRQLRADPNRLFALPYRLGAALRAPGLLAAYTALKNRFLAP